MFLNPAKPNKQMSRTDENTNGDDAAKRKSNKKPNQPPPPYRGGYLDEESQGFIFSMLKMSGKEFHQICKRHNGRKKKRLNTHIFYV